MTRPANCPAEHACGTRPAYEAGCQNDGCRLMMVLHTKDERPPDSVPPKASEKRIYAEPYAMLLRELLRRGFTMRQLAKMSGYSAVSIRDIALGFRHWIYPDGADAIRRIVEHLPSEREGASA